MGLLSLMDPVEPSKAASPKLKIPPSEAATQYPSADGGVAAAGCPVPDSATSWWPSGAESSKLTVADLAPAPAGVKVNDTMHVPPPAATVVPLHVSVVLVKSPGLRPPTETADTVNGPPA